MNLFNILVYIPVLTTNENKQKILLIISSDIIVIQAYTSVGKAGLNLRDHRDLAMHMNTLVFHTKMVDYLDELLVETSDLSIYWWVFKFCYTFDSLANINY